GQPAGRTGHRPGGSCPVEPDGQDPSRYSSTPLGGWFRYPASGQLNQPDEAMAPPSGWSVVPVTNEDRWDARNRAQPPASSKVPSRAMGVAMARCSSRAAFPPPLAWRATPGG